jgi:hypothetical protein
MSETKPGVYVSSLADFASQFGADTSYDNVFVGLVENNLPSRWRWLAQHERLLNIAFFLRPSWSPDLRVARVAAEVAAEEASSMDVTTSEVFTEFEQHFGPLSIERWMDADTQADLEREMRSEFVVARLREAEEAKGVEL